MQHLPERWLLMAGRVCRLWSELAQDEGIWLQQVLDLHIRAATIQSIFT
jgi:hypothetical protein